MTSLLHVARYPTRCGTPRRHSRSLLRGRNEIGCDTRGHRAFGFFILVDGFPVFHSAPDESCGFLGSRDSAVKDTLVFLDSLPPVIEVFGVLTLAIDLEVRTKERCCEFCYELFFRVSFRPESIVEPPGKPCLVTCRVGELMERCRVVFLDDFELMGRRYCHDVNHWTIEGSVPADDEISESETVVCRVNEFLDFGIPFVMIFQLWEEMGVFLRVKGRLFDVVNELGSLSPEDLGLWLAIVVEDRLSVGVDFCLLVRSEPDDWVGIIPLVALGMCPKFLELSPCGPERGLESVSVGDTGEVESVASVVVATGLGVPVSTESLPGLGPGSDAFFELGENHFNLFILSVPSHVTLRQH